MLFNLIRKPNLTRTNVVALIHALLRSMDDSAEKTAAVLSNSNEKIELTFPPNVSYTQEEIVALKKISEIPNIKPALKKLLIDSSSSTMFQLLSILDGVSDPADENWKGITLIDTKDIEACTCDLIHEEMHNLMSSEYGNHQKK